MAFQGSVWDLMTDSLSASSPPTVWPVGSSSSNDSSRDDSDSDSFSSVSASVSVSASESESSAASASASAASLGSFDFSEYGHFRMSDLKSLTRRADAAKVKGSPPSVTRFPLLSQISRDVHMPEMEEDDDDRGVQVIMPDHGADDMYSTSSMSIEEEQAFETSRLKRYKGGPPITLPDLTPGSSSPVKGQYQQAVKRNRKSKNPTFFWTRNMQKKILPTLLRPISETQALSASTGESGDSSSAATGNEASLFSSDDEQRARRRRRRSKASISGDDQHGSSSLAETFDASSLSSFEEDIIASMVHVDFDVRSNATKSSTKDEGKKETTSSDNDLMVQLETASTAETSVPQCEPRNAAHDEPETDLSPDDPQTGLKLSSRMCYVYVLMVFCLFILAGVVFGLMVRRPLTSMASTLSPTVMLQSEPSSSPSLEPTHDFRKVRAPVSFTLIFAQSIEDATALADLMEEYLNQSMMATEGFLFVELSPLQKKNGINGTFGSSLGETSIRLVGNVVFGIAADTEVITSVAENVCGFLKDVESVERFLSEDPSFNGVIYNGPRRQDCDGSAPSLPIEYPAESNGTPDHPPTEHPTTEKAPLSEEMSNSPAAPPSTVPISGLASSPSATAADLLDPDLNVSQTPSAPHLELTVYLGSAPGNVRWHFDQLSTDGVTMFSGSCHGCYASDSYKNEKVTEYLPFRIGSDGNAELKISLFDDSSECGSNTACTNRGYGKFRVSYGDKVWGDEFDYPTVQKETSFNVKIFSDGSATLLQPTASTDTYALPRPIFGLEERPSSGPFVEATFSFDLGSAMNVGWNLSRLNDDDSGIVLYEHAVGTYSSPAFRFKTLTLYIPIPLGTEEAVNHFRFTIEDASTESDCCWDFSWYFVDENDIHYFGSNILDQGQVVPMRITDSFSVTSDGFLNSVTVSSENSLSD